MRGNSKPYVMWQGDEAKSLYVDEGMGMGEKGLGYRWSQTKESYDNLLVFILIKNFLNEFEHMHPTWMNNVVPGTYSL